MKVSNLKLNPNNPRRIKPEELDKLVASIRTFPEMMDKRPLVCVTDTDGKLYPLGGNQRLKAIQKIGKKEIPDTWVMLADEWTAEQRNEFLIKDNIALGEWDFDMLKLDWDTVQLEDWGLDLPFENDFSKIEIKEDDEFLKEFEEITDKNCLLPIVPDFFENHECFLIPTHNKIDENFIRDVFRLNEIYRAEPDDKKRLKTNVISVEKIREWTNR